MKSCPGSKKKAAQHNAIIAFVDETKCQLRANLHRTWGKVGHTPVVVSETSPASVKLIGALTSSGELDLYRAKGSVNQAEMVRYLEHLCEQFEDQKLIIVWDNASWHNVSNEVESFLKSEAGKQIVEVAYFPSYAPELNPEELVWKTLKCEYLGNHQCGVIAHLIDVIEDSFEWLAERVNPLAYIEHVKKLYPPLSGDSRGG
jgi:transposase